MPAQKQSKTFHGYRVIASHHTPGWGHLDETEDVGEFRVLNTRRSEPTDQQASYGVGPTFTHTIRAPRDASAQHVRDALQDTFTTGCRCEHDCCGHMSTYPKRVQKVRRRNWVVELYTAFNV